MSNKKTGIILLVCLYAIPTLAFNEPQPADDCPDMSHVGSGSITYWINDNVPLSGDDRCDFGVGVVDPMSTGDFVFGVIGSDVLEGGAVEDTDFKSYLAGSLKSLRIGDQLTFAQFWFKSTLVAEMKLRKVGSPISESIWSNSTGGRGNDFFWEVKVVWYGPMGLQFSEDKFSFAADDTVEVNYVCDRSVLEMPVSMISLGEAGSTFNPFMTKKSMCEYQQLHFGIVDLSGDLEHGDMLRFSLYYDTGGAVDI